MPHIKGMSGRCSCCDKRFYAPYGFDGEPYGVAFEDGRISRDRMGCLCSVCLDILWKWGGPVWRDKAYWWDRPWENRPEGDAILLPAIQERTDS